MKIIAIIALAVLFVLFLLLGCQTPRSMYINSKDCLLSEDGSYYTCYYIKDGKVFRLKDKPH
jgi:hypothetical protein